ncbi:MAG TPA: hypothetical protein VIY51_01330 [Xanthobacteraceae bacterium]
MIKCNSKRGSLGLAAVALGLLASASVGTAAPLSRASAFRPVAIPAAPTAAAKLSAIPVKPTVVLGGAAASTSYPTSFNGKSATRTDITVAPTATQPGSVTSIIADQSGQTLWRTTSTCNFGSACARTGPANSVPTPATTTASTPAAPKYSQSVIAQAAALGTTPQNVMNLASAPRPGDPTSFVLSKQTKVKIAGVTCSAGVLATYTRSKGLGGSAWSYTCA